MSEREDEYIPSHEELLRNINKIAKASQKVFEESVRSGDMDNELDELTPPLYEGDVRNRVITLPDGKPYVLRQRPDGLGTIEPLMGGGGA